MKNTMNSFGVHKTHEFNASDGGYSTFDLIPIATVVLYIFTAAYCIWTIVRGK